MTSAFGWHKALISDVLIKRHLFFHSTDVNSSAGLKQDLVLSAPEGISIGTIDCNELPLTATKDVDGSAISTIDCDILAILDFQVLLTLSRGRTWMRQLRPHVMRLLESGTRLIVASRSPQSSYPPIDGSSLATDCLLHIPSPLHATDFPTMTPSPVVDEIVQRSAGLVGPASEMFDPGVLSLNSAAEASKVLRRHLIGALTQCGPEVLSWLERLVITDHELRFDVREVPAKVASILLGAGIGIMSVQTDELKILPRISVELFNEVLSEAEMSVLSAPRDWSEVAAGLFQYERTARRALTSYLRNRGSIDDLTPLREKIRRNYSAENGVTAPPLSDIPNAVRWIDLSDLLDLLQDKATNSRLAGLSTKQWSQAKSDILPLRNKIQHMRLPAPDDMALLRRHLGIIKLSE